MRVVLTVLSLVLGFLMWTASRVLPQTGRGLTRTVENSMKESGVEHPVTAVLLNFRAYDTWLEVGVLLMAVLGAGMIAGNGSLERRKNAEPANPVLASLVRLLFPIILLACGYLLWLGKFASGGAFQAGVVLASGAVLAALAGTHFDTRKYPGLWKGALLAGFVAFFAVAIVTQLWGGTVLGYPKQWAGDLILFIEFFATISIGVALAALVIGLRFSDEGREAS